MLLNPWRMAPRHKTRTGRSIITRLCVTHLPPEHSVSPFACSIMWTLCAPCIQDHSTHLCPVHPKAFSTLPFSLRRQTSSLSWGHPPAPQSPLQSSISAALPDSSRLSGPSSPPTPEFLHPPPPPRHSAAALVTCFSHFSRTHWYAPSLGPGSCHCLRDGNHPRPGHLFLVLFQPCSTYRETALVFKLKNIVVRCT